MNDSEIKKNQVHDLSDASSALSAEIDKYRPHGPEYEYVDME